CLFTLTFSMKLLFRSFFLLLCSATPALAGIPTYNVTKAELRGGFLMQQVDVPSETIIRLVKTECTPVSGLPAGAVAAAAEDFTRKNGIERKKPFAILRIPAYRRDANGNYSVLS